MKNSQDVAFGCRAAVAHYLYTFMFNPMPELEEGIRNRKERTRIIGRLREKGSKHFTETHVHWGSREMEQRGWNDMLDPFLYVRHPHIEFRAKPADLSVIAPGRGRRQMEGFSRSASFRPRLLLFPSGMGIVDYRLAFPYLPSLPGTNRLLVTEDIVDLLTLGLRQSKTPKACAKLTCGLAICQDDGSEFLLHKAFWRDVTACREVLNTSGAVRCDVSWVEVDEDLVGGWNGTASRKLSAGSRLFALPYPMFIGEVPAETYDLVFPRCPQSPALAVPPMGQDDAHPKRWPCDLLSNILTTIFRSREFGEPDWTFAYDKKVLSGSGLVNMCSIRTMFTHLFHRACLVLSPALEIDPSTGKICAAPGTYIEDALVETVSYLRMLWHVFTITSARLDRVLTDLCDQMVNVYLGLSEASTYTEDLVPRLISRLRCKQLDLLRAKAAGIRALQDPVSCRLGSQTMSNVFNHGVECFHIEELRRAVVGKMDHLSRLHDEISAYIRWAETDRIRSMWRSSQGSGGARRRCKA